VGGPAAVDGQDDAGEVAGGGVGEQQGGAGELGGLGPPADRDLCGQEVADLRVVVHARVQRGAEWAGGERVDGYPGAGQFDGQAAGELDNGALAGGVPGPGGAADQAEGAGHGQDAAVPGVRYWLLGAGQRGGQIKPVRRVPDGPVC